jgi:hypothetical protein
MLVRPLPTSRRHSFTKKTDVAEHWEALGHVGLLINNPTGEAKLRESGL